MLPSKNNRRARIAAFAAPQVGPVGEIRPSREDEISSVTVYPLREPVSRRRYDVFKLQTKSGLSGYGECAHISADDLGQARNSLIGMAVTAYEVLRYKLQAMPGVQAAVNMALLDILGKSVHAPVYQVMGGPTRFKARVMTALNGNSDAELVASFEHAHSAGFRAFMVPLPATAGHDTSRALIYATQRRLQKLQTAGGGHSDFVLVGTGELSAEAVHELVSALERFGFLWFDEPCNPSTLQALAKTSGMSVGLGKQLHQGISFLDLLREGLADVIRPDMALNGILQSRRIAALAETYYVAVAPRHDGGPIATAAALHLAASLPNFFIQQIPFPEHENDRHMRTDLAGTSIEKAEDGFVRIPTGDGLGIKVNEEALEKNRESSP